LTVDQKGIQSHFVSKEQNTEMIDIRNKRACVEADRSGMATVSHVSFHQSPILCFVKETKQKQNKIINHRIDNQTD